MTIPEIVKAVGQMEPVQAEWLTITETEQYAKIGKTAIYRMINEGMIKSIEFKVKATNLRGTRLIYLPSLRAYMLGLLECDEGVNEEVGV